MSGFSHCVECDRRLRDAFFCPECGLSACCWHCLETHRARHRSGASGGMNPRRGKPGGSGDPRPPREAHGVRANGVPGAE
jgi:hypothetical protein